MKDLFLVFLLSLSFSLFSQGGRSGPAFSAAVIMHLSQSSALYEDDFESYASGTNLHATASWSQEINTLKINDNSGDNRVNPATSSVENIAFYDETFDGNHYSQMVVDAIAQYAWIGVAVRCQNGGGDAYIYSSDGTDCRLSRVIDGVRTDLDDTGTPFSVTDIIRLEVNGYELSCYINDALDTAIDSDGIYDDSASEDKLDGGNPGLEGCGNSVSSDIDDWEGGNL